MAPELLAERILSDGGFSGGHNLLVLPECEPRIEENLLGSQPQLFQPDRVGARPFRSTHVVEGRTAPATACTQQQVDRLVRRSVRQGRATLTDLPLKAVDIEFVFANGERVTAGTAMNPIPFKELTKQRNVAGQR
ncbi:MAG TPA: hypothetical protein VGJ79_02650 [Candidatus Dormibacteraeota bacterium]